MAYNKDELKIKSIEAIKKNRLIFVEDVCAMIGISKPTFYDYFKVDSNDFNELSNLLNENKIALKVSLRKKWFDSDNATTQLALYRLCATSDEHRKLNQAYIDHSGTIHVPNIEVTDNETSDAIKSLFTNE